MTDISDASKDQLVLTLLAVLGGESREVNERDLFRASWHAFPQVMRWVDTPLPNTETFTAVLRRLDQRGLIIRTGKQNRSSGKRRTRSTLEPARSKVVKAKLSPEAIESGAIDQELLSQVSHLMPPAELTVSLTNPALITICIGLGLDEGGYVDEGSLVETAFHKFADRFAFALRPEFPDTGAVRDAIRAAESEGLIAPGFRLTPAGSEVLEAWKEGTDAPLERATNRHHAGDLTAAARIEKLPSFKAFQENGTLALTKADELYRTLRIPPTHDPVPVADSLVRKVRGLRRVDKPIVAQYLICVAEKHNPEVLHEACRMDTDLGLTNNNNEAES